MIMFLRWWFIVTLSTCGMVLAGVLGLYRYILQVDATYLSFVSIALFVAMSIFVGYLSWTARHGNQDFTKHLPLCWFSAELMLGFGMMGTLIGFLIMLQGAFGGGLDLTNTSTTQQALTRMALGFATAGITTVVGLACSMLLKAQLINLEYALRDENEG